jgi:hypothetical protein
LLFFSSLLFLLGPCLPQPLGFALWKTGWNERSAPGGQGRPRHHHTTAAAYHMPPVC